MPMTARVIRLLHITLSLSALANVLLVGILAVVMKTSPNEVLQAVNRTTSEIKITNETFRTAITANHEELKDLREKMQRRDDQLKKANERLIKIDPSYIPEQ